MLLVIATATSALAVLAMSTEFRFVLLLPAAALAVATGSFAAGRARVAQGRAFLAERALLTPIIWIGLILRTLRSMSLPFSGGDSAADVGAWFLGGTWAWGGLGVAAFGAKRLYEREAALARIARQCGSQPPAGWPILVLTFAAAMAIVAPLLLIYADPILIVAAALLAATGALLLGLGFPGGVRSRLGRGLLLVGSFALCASLAPSLTIVVGLFAYRVAPDPLAPIDEIAYWLGVATSYALLGAWLFFGRPFAGHERRLALRYIRGLP
jgi:hypothetical protein